MLSKHIPGKMIWFREEKRNKTLQEEEKIDREQKKNRRVRKFEEKSR